MAGFDNADTPEAVIRQAIGAGSTCWENLSGTGTFQSETALMYSEQAIARLRELGVTW